MKPLDFPLLADESVASDVVATLVEGGRDVRSVHDEGLTGAADTDILRRGNEQGRVILTHDSDFGRLVFQSGEAFVGVIYLRPGHIAASFVLEMIAGIASRDEEVEPPFVLVAERRGDTIRIRVRRVGAE